MPFQVFGAIQHFVKSAGKAWLKWSQGEEDDLELAKRLSLESLVVEEHKYRTF